MIKKLLKPIIKFTLDKITKHFVICPYINNEAKYMAKGIKPFSEFWDSLDFLNNYIFPKFEPLIKSGVVLEKKEYTKMPTKKGVIDLIRVYYYYQGEEWRIKRFEILFDKYLDYKKSHSIREGLLFGYPKKYIRRHIFWGKIKKWLYIRGLY